MALLTSGRISQVAVELLTRQLTLARTVTMIPGGEFSGDNGDTITVRVPQPGASRVQAAPGAAITYDDLTEIPVDVSLSHLYHAKRVTDEELSLDIVDFGRQVLNPQVNAVATGAEDLLVAAMNAVPSVIDFALTATEADTRATLLAAREALAADNVPAGDRFLAISPQISTRLLSMEGFVDVDRSGSPDALREATLGRIFGFTVVEAPGLEAGTAVAYHRSGFVFANRVPVAPRGATSSATATAGGVGLRHVLQYVPDRLSDASVVSTFAGAAAVADNATPTTAAHYPRAVRITTAAA